ncbi:ABC transporter ATP-binding protein [Nitrospinaceae bacterium]|nr:ABC transporter ATP-binding protein [Nitrospinaceae bacterium]
MSFSNLSSLLVLARGRCRSLALLYVLILGSAVMESIGIASFYPMVDMFQDAGQLGYYHDKFTSWIPALESLDREQFLSFTLLGVGALFVFKNLFLVLAGYGNLKVITGLYCSWMNRIFKIYMDKPYTFFLENKAGDLVQRKILQTQKASSALKTFVMLLGSITTALGVFFVLCLMSLKISLGIVFLIVPVYFVTTKISQGRVYKGGDRIVELEKQGFSLTTEVLSGIKQVKVFCAEDHFQERTKAIWKEYSQHYIHNQFLGSLPRPILETLVVLSGVATLFIFIQVSGQGKETFPVLAVFAIGIFRMIPLSAGASSQAMSLAALLPSAETIAALLWQETETKKGSSAPLMTNQIEFENVSFSYKGREIVLDDLSLKFENNKFYGIVGASGSGKSTIVDLIAGFFKPQKGRVLIDDMDLRDVNVNTWLSQVGIISQEAFIFSGTIEDNICFGVDAENRNLSRMKEAAGIAYADEFIEQLPEGYQTLLGERGVKLSGGQRQRLAIARAIYLNPPVLIFDEATSSLDANSERKVQEAIEALHGKRTVIVVAHRLVTVSSADYIFVLENGSLSEEGTHEQLRESKGLYSRLCAKQSLD